jgi:hypothetical protein
MVKSKTLKKQRKSIKLRGGVKTRKLSRNGKIVHVRSEKDIPALHNMIFKGPTEISVVFALLKGCGPCEGMKREVISHLTSLKQRGMNIATVDSEVFNKTKLASIPRKFYPTILLVGKDGKAATFPDEMGEPTNSMPRKATLEEDKKALTALIQSPIKGRELMNNGVNSMANTNQDVVNTLDDVNEVNSVNNVNSVNSMNSNKVNLNKINKSNSNKANVNLADDEHIEDEQVEVNKTVRNMPIKQMPASPFENIRENENPSIASTLSPKKMTYDISAINKNVSQPKLSGDSVDSDILASQGRAQGAKTGTAVAVGKQEGGMLKAIRKYRESVDAVLKMRKPKTRRR